MKELAINEQIVAKEVRLLGEQGEQLGIFSIKDALAQADEAGLDLVAINPNASPIVCRIMDYGKYKFIAQKRDKDAKKKQKIAEVKGMELSMRIEEHDMRYKANQVAKFLKNGDKVRVIIKGVRGRMANFAHFGIDNMNKFYEMLAEYCVIDQKPTLSGSVITMILAPKTAK
ncbi:MAG: translation initiation factor IF-3 [Clostridia bacterium]|nr:translation initiation factor IF-3 [Clostridia bacterium]